jgi:hypothetical protein
MSYSCAVDIQLFVPKTGVYCFSLLNNLTLLGDLFIYIRGRARPQQMINIDKPYNMHLNLHAGDVVEISGILDGVQKDTKLKVDEGIYVFTYNFYDFVKKDNNSTTQLMTTDDVNEIKCSHDWKEYIGFTERYKYCTKCDNKENQ